MGRDCLFIVFRLDQEASRELTMLEFLVFLRDAFVALLLSWVGIDEKADDKKPADNPEPVKTQLIAPSPKLY